MKWHKSKILVFLVLILSLPLTGCGKTEEAQAVDDMIASIGEVKDSSEKAVSEAEEAYNALNEDEQKSLDNYNALVESRQELDSLKADAVKEKIDEIGTIDENSKKRITQARTAYEALSIEQQALVDNFNVLTDAEQSYDVIMMGKVAEVETLIDGIGEIFFSDECEQALKTAENAYRALDVSYRSKVQNGQVLSDARSAYNQLSPIQLNSYRVSSTFLDTSHLYLNATNITEKVIKEFTVRIFIYDNDNLPVKTSSIGGYFSERLNYTNPLKAGNRTKSNSYWYLDISSKDIKKVVAYVEEVEFYDDTSWENPQSSVLYSRYNEKLLEAGDENILKRG